MKQKYKWEKKDAQLIPLLITYFIFLIFIFGESFFLLKAQTSGYTLSLLPLFVITSTLTQTLFSYVIGKRIDHWGGKKILLASFFFGFLATIALYFNTLWIAFIFLGLSTVSSLNAMRSIISQKAKNKATIYGIFYAGTATTSAFGALIIGYIWHHFGDSHAIEFSALGIIFLSLFTFLLNFTKKNL